MGIFNFRYSNFVLLIPADILSEDAVLKWYKESHSQRGWSVFADQMKKFVEWLEHAEEGKLIFSSLPLIYPDYYFLN